MARFATSCLQDQGSCGNCRQPGGGTLHNREVGGAKWTPKAHFNPHSYYLHILIIKKYSLPTYFFWLRFLLVDFLRFFFAGGSC